jgi:carbamoyl-phosphate synthase large subunit
MKVLISSLGSNTSISVIKALRMSKMEKLTLIGTDLNPARLCAGAHMVDKFFQLPSAKKPLNYESALLEILEAEKVDCVIGIHDLEIELMASFKVKYPEMSFWAVNHPSIIELCNQKHKANLFCEKLGIPVPKTYSIDELQKLGTSEFPIIAKPLAGVSSMGIEIFQSQDELTYFLSNHSASRYLFQEIVEGDEYTVDCYSSYSDGSFVGGVARKRIATKAGISVKGEIVKNEGLISLCKEILEKMNFKGAANLQFIANNETFFFIEINPRFSGAGILSYKGGFNSPLFTITEASGKTKKNFGLINIEYGLTMVRYWQEQFYNEEGLPV